MNKRLMGAIGCLLMCGAMHAQAAVVIYGTRVVFNADEREVTVRLSNDGQEPGLVQAWLDDGDQDVAPERAKVPFVLTPPMFRVDPGKGQSIRMLYDGTPLPRDRESLFWLNVLEMPPRPDTEADVNYMQMAFRTRIKVFFRPQALASQERIFDAHATLKWSLLPAPEGGHVLRLDNPSPYHVSVTKAELLDAAGKSLAESDIGDMAAPGQHAMFRFAQLQTQPSGVRKLRYTFLNDYGAASARDAELTVTGNQ